MHGDCDWCLGRLFNEWNSVVANFHHRPVIVGNLKVDIATDCLSGFLEFDLAALKSNAVDDDFDAVLQALDFVERHHQANQVPQAGQVELRDDNDIVGQFERREVAFRESFGDVDHDVSARGCCWRASVP